MKWMNTVAMECGGSGGTQGLPATLFFCAIGPDGSLLCIVRGVHDHRHLASVRVDEGPTPIGYKPSRASGSRYARLSRHVFLMRHINPSGPL